MLGGAPLPGLCPGRHGSFAIQIFVAVALVVTSLLIMTDFYELDIEENLDAVLESALLRRLGGRLFAVVFCSPDMFAIKFVSKFLKKSPILDNFSDKSAFSYAGTALDRFPYQFAFAGAVIEWGVVYCGTCGSCCVRAEHTGVQFKRKS